MFKQFSGKLCFYYKLLKKKKIVKPTNKKLNINLITVSTYSYNSFAVS